MVKKAYLGTLVTVNRLESKQDNLDCSSKQEDNGLREAASGPGDGEPTLCDYPLTSQEIQSTFREKRRNKNKLYNHILMDVSFKDYVWQ